jgi:hypothetical protein
MWKNIFGGYGKWEMHSICKKLQKKIQPPVCANELPPKDQADLGAVQDRRQSL